MTAVHPELKRAARLRAPEAGFSLIEVMISMVLLAFGVLAMGAAQLYSLRYSADADNRSQATYLAEEWLATLMAAPETDVRLNTVSETRESTIVLSETTAVGFSGGNDDGVGRTMRYERFWSVQPLPAPRQALRQITVRVAWTGSAGLQSSVQLMGIR